MAPARSLRPRKDSKACETTSPHKSLTRQPLANLQTREGVQAGREARTGKSASSSFSDLEDDLFCDAEGDFDFHPQLAEDALNLGDTLSQMMPGNDIVTDPPLMPWNWHMKPVRGPGHSHLGAVSPAIEYHPRDPPDDSLTTLSNFLDASSSDHEFSSFDQMFDGPRGNYDDRADLEDLCDYRLTTNGETPLSSPFDDVINPILMREAESEDLDVRSQSSDFGNVPADQDAAASFTTPSESQQDTQSEYSVDSGQISYVQTTSGYRCGHPECASALTIHDTPSQVKKDWKPHIPMHERKYGCEHCKWRFHYPKDLERHHRRHTKERPYKCERCGDLLVRTDHLLRHQGKCKGR